MAVGLAAAGMVCCVTATSPPTAQAEKVVTVGHSKFCGPMMGSGFAADGERRDLPREIADDDGGCFVC